jgi:hypothetical protein
MTIEYENKHRHNLASPMFLLETRDPELYYQSQLQWRHVLKSRYVLSTRHQGFDARRTVKWELNWMNSDGSDSTLLPGFFLPSLLHVPSSPETRFANELCYIMDRKGLHDGWPSFVPRYLGHDQGVDAAAACIMKALQGVATQRPSKAIEAACAPTYAIAISILQSKLRHPQIGSGDFALLMAVLFVCIDWIIHPEGGHAVTSHVQGANAIILSLPPQKAPSELRRSVL